MPVLRDRETVKEGTNEREREREREKEKERTSMSLSVREATIGNRKQE